MTRTSAELPLLLCGLLCGVGCGSAASVADGGESDAASTVDAGIDAGTSVDAGTDAGLTIDAGVDAGFDAGPDAGFDGGPGETVTLTVAANPNSVLSAVATVSWTGPLVSLSLSVTSDGSQVEEPPQIDLTGLSSPQTAPILGLYADTAYTMLAVGADADGHTVASFGVSFMSGALPAGVPAFTTAGTASEPYALVARLPAQGASTPDYLTVSDSMGVPIWYVGVTPGAAGDFQRQPDGTYTVAIADPADQISGVPETASVYQQFAPLGTLLSTWSAVSDVTATPDPATIIATDGHDIRMQPNGDALLLGFDEATGVDLSTYGGTTTATVVGDVLERVTAGGTVSFAWDTLQRLDYANVDPAATTLMSPVVDFTQANAIDVTSDGDYLLSVRNFSQVLKIDSTTGAIVWKLGGKDGQFTFKSDPLGGFSCQSGSREVTSSDGLTHILLFDNGDGHAPRQSRAVEYALDLTAMTATLYWSSGYMAGASTGAGGYTPSLGYAQRLTNGNTLVTYGVLNDVEEVDPTGTTLLWDLTDPTMGAGLYRAYELSSIYTP